MEQFFSPGSCRILRGATCSRKGVDLQVGYDRAALFVLLSRNRERHTQRIAKRAPSAALVRKKKSINVLERTHVQGSQLFHSSAQAKESIDTSKVLSNRDIQKGKRCFFFFLRVSIHRILNDVIVEMSRSHDRWHVILYLDVPPDRHCQINGSAEPHYFPGEVKG